MVRGEGPALSMRPDERRPKPEVISRPPSTWFFSLITCGHEPPHRLTHAPMDAALCMCERALPYTVLSSLCSSLPPSQSRSLPPSFYNLLAPSPPLPSSTCSIPSMLLLSHACNLRSDNAETDGRLLLATLESSVSTQQSNGEIAQCVQRPSGEICCC